MESRPQILRFDAFEIDCENRELRKHGRPIELGSRYFDALMLLVTRRGELVTKDTFMEQVWHGVPVTDEALTQCIRTLRRALGDDATNARFIQTVPKHGYRFIAATPYGVEAVAHVPVSLVAGATTLSGLAAGAGAGLIYGMIAVTGGAGQVLILAAMVGALGLLAGAGLGAGMAASLIWRKRADGWIVVGTAISGLCVGALGNLLGREGLGLLSGNAIAHVTGPFEGAALGFAAGISAWAALAGWPWRKVFATAFVTGAFTATLILFSGGTLLAGSLQSVERGLAGAQLRVAKIGILIGEPGLTRAARGLTTLVECQVFLLAVVTGLLAVRNRLTKQG